MELSESKELVITNDALKYARIIAEPIENEFQRKRAFASIVALDALADYLVTQDITVSITKNLFKIAPVNEEFEISDVYYNGWKLDVRLVINDEFVSIPKSHFRFDILADMYIAIRVDSKLENAELLGFIEGAKVSKTIDSGAYYLMDVENLSSVEELVAKLQESKNIIDILTDHSAFENLYLAYLDNDVDTVAKKSFIKHISTCAECRSDFVEFYDFEAIVKNSALCPEIFEDHTLSIVGGQVIDQPQYVGKEELIAIRDSNESKEPDKSEHSDDSDNGDILGELFENSHNNLLMENTDKNLLNAGVLAAGVLGVGAVIASTTAGANAATLGTIEAGAAVVEAGADLISSSAELLNNDFSLDDLTLDAPEDSMKQSADLDFLTELADLNAENVESSELSLLDVDPVNPDETDINLGMELAATEDEDSLFKEFLSDEIIEEKEDCLCSEGLDSLFAEYSEAPTTEDEELVNPIEEDNIDIVEDELMELDLSEESDSLFEDELIAPPEDDDSDILEDDGTEDQDAAFLSDDEESIDDFKNSYSNEPFDDAEETSAFDEEVSPIDNSLIDEFGNDLAQDEEEDFMPPLLDSEDDFVGNDILDEEESVDDDNFMSFSKQEEEFIQDEKDYSFEPYEQTVTDEEHLDEFKDFINAGNEMKEDENETESLDNEILLSYSSEEEDDDEGEIEILDNEPELSDTSENDEEESSKSEFLIASSSVTEETEVETEPEAQEVLFSDSLSNDEQQKRDLKFLYETNVSRNDEVSDTNEQIEYIINKDDGLSIFQDKKMIILASCFVGCLLFGTIFGVSAYNNKNKLAKENAELANQQLQDQTNEINQDMNSLTPIPMGDNTTGEELAKGSSANVHKDMDKVMTNVFDENPSTVAVTKISWEVSQSIASNELFTKYLQIAGKNLQLNLKNDLINATEFAYNDKIRVLIIIGKDNSIKKLEIINTSGSEQIDELVLQSIKETLKYINVPQLPDSAVPSQHNLAKDNAYNLKLVINF